MNSPGTDVQMIPIDQIHILNPRSRNKIVFASILSNISNIGLKRPVTVARRPPPNDGKPYDLVCGQGRLEAFLALGQKEIPAIVIEATREDCFLMSLVENIARRRHSPLELLREIGNLRTRGYSVADIAKKIDLSRNYVSGIVHLLDHGEDRLIAAVEKGKIPLSVAIQISNADEAGVQRALSEAYDDQTLRGKKLFMVRRIIDQRNTNGKRFEGSPKPKSEPPSSPHALVRIYRQEVDRQQLLVKRAQLTESRLLMIASALKQLFHDENFVTLLRAEELNTLPTYLSERIQIAQEVR